MKKLIPLSLILVSWPLFAGPTPDLRLSEISDLATANEYGITVEEFTYSPIALFPEPQCGYAFTIHLSITEIQKSIDPVNTLSFSIVERDTATLVWGETIDVNFDHISRTFYLFDRSSHYFLLLIRGGQVNTGVLSIDISSLVAEAAQSANLGEDDLRSAEISKDCYQKAMP